MKRQKTRRALALCLTTRGLDITSHEFVTPPEYVIKLALPTIESLGFEVTVRNGLLCPKWTPVTETERELTGWSSDSITYRSEDHPLMVMGRYTTQMVVSALNRNEYQLIIARNPLFIRVKQGSREDCIRTAEEEFRSTVADILEHVSSGHDP